MLADLSELAKQVPQGIPLTIRELTVEGASVHLEGETNSFDSVEKIKQAFGTNQLSKACRSAIRASVPPPTRWCFA